MSRPWKVALGWLTPKRHELRSLQPGERGLGVANDDGRQQPVIGRQEHVSLGLHRHDIPGGADARIDHGHVHRSRGKVDERPRQPEAGLCRPMHDDLVGEVDDARCREAREDASLHDPDERPFMAEIGRDRDDARRHGWVGSCVESTTDRTGNARTIVRESRGPPLSSAYDRLPLNALRVFEAVAERLNFGEAAEALHVTPAAVSQQIRTLEDYLQTPLFRRSGRNVQLTPEGARLLPGVRRGLDQLEAALNGLRQDRHAGALNVTTTNSFLQKWLLPRLADLHARHPDIELRLHTSPDIVDFSRSDFHLALRFGRGNYEGLCCEKLLDEWPVAVASPADAQQIRSPARRWGYLPIPAPAWH